MSKRALAVVIILSAVCVAAYWLGLQTKILSERFSLRSDSMKRAVVDAHAQWEGSLDAVIEIERTFFDRIPNDLTAEQYYNLGVQHKSAFKAELAREAFTRAVNLDHGTIRLKAQRYLVTKIPLHHVPLRAEQAHLTAFNLDLTGHKQEALDLWRQTVSKYPDFEWPYNNLACYYLAVGDTAEASRLLIRALKINPNYTNALLNAASICIKQKDPLKARLLVQHALQADPDDIDARNYAKRLGIPIT